MAAERSTAAAVDVDRRRACELHRHRPRVAYNGREGLRQLEVETPDLVVLDVDMPVLTGPDMARAMFVHNVGLDRIPVILVSGVPDLREGHPGRDTVCAGQAVPL